MKEKYFSLIELIVVIVIISIVAAIVIPNIQDIQSKAKVASLQSDLRNIQTAVDMYSLDNRGNYPTLFQPKLFKPEVIDFTKLVTDYLRSSPQDENIKYWVDFTGKVWMSNLDSPNVKILESNVIEWNRVENAQSYNIYEVEFLDTYGSLNFSKANYILIYNVKDTGEDKYSYRGEEGKIYAVSTISNLNLESPL